VSGVLIGEKPDYNGVNRPLDQSGMGNQAAVNASLQLDAIFRAFPDLLFFMDADGQILDFRNGNTSFFQLPPEKILGHSMRDILPPEIGSRFNHTLRDTLKTGKIISIEYKLQFPEGEHWFEARLVPFENESRVIAIVRDVSERVRNTERIQSQLRRLYALHSVDAAITASFDLKVTLSVILRQMINQLGVDAADILILNPSTHMLEFASGQGFQVMQSQPLPLMIGQGYAGKAALERRTITIPDLINQPSDPTLAPSLLHEKFTNYYAVPVIAKGQVKGVLEIYHHSLLQPDDDWLDFLSTMANQAAVAIDSANLLQDLQRSNAELSLAYDASIESWAQVLELSNRENGAHAYRVVDLTIKLARLMGIAEQELIHFRRGALLHDVGKLGIPENILNKPGPLDEAEWKIMRTHPQLAYDLLSSVNYLAPALDIPHYHHERWDGSGYPDDLFEEQIPFPARLFAVVDVYDALTSTRSYRPAWSRQVALNYIQQSSGKLFDPAVVKAFLQIMKERP
jgi:PAS domain S-box-containing protein